MVDGHLQEVEVGLGIGWGQSRDRLVLDWRQTGVELELAWY